MSTQIVVARYTENIDWLKSFADDTIIYNKGPRLTDLVADFKVHVLNNVGRESHTYLYHIIDNYDDMKKHKNEDDVCIFLQGHIQDHIEENVTPEEFVKRLIEETKEHGISQNFMIHEVGSMRPMEGLKFSDKWNLTDSNMYFGPWMRKYVCHDLSTPLNYKDIPWYKAALFGVKVGRILKNSKDYYLDLYTTVNTDINMEASHYMERAWYMMFK